MQKYLFVYHSHGLKPESKEEHEKMMAEWMAWFDSIQASVVDPGNPVGKSITVLSDGSVRQDGGSNPAAGYTVVRAQSLEDATEIAKSCPLQDGESLEIAPLFEMP